MIEADFLLSRGAFTLEVAFTAAAGVTALFGSSGSGKTTALNAIAGIERPNRGRIAANGTIFFDSAKAIDLPVHRRGIGYVFQSDLLFPHLTVAANLRYGMKPAGSDFDRVVATLGIEPLLGRRPARLSGGERQRVAIGRAVLSAPRLLLMDEPLASLDTERKQEILPLIESLRDRLGLPILYVSHAVDEVARLADQVLVIDRGRIVARGSPDVALARQLGTAPTRFERVSLLHGTAQSFDAGFGLTTLRHAAGPITVVGHLEAGRDIRILVRATDVTLANAAPSHLSIRTSLKGSIATIEETGGATAIVTVSLDGGQTLAAAATRKAVAAMGLAAGQPVWCLIKSVSIDERWLPGA